ncbi:MAG: ABC transporter substrate-binding protein [Candidatus Aenigmatarchaeota archaeon]
MRKAIILAVVLVVVLILGIYFLLLPQKPEKKVYKVGVLSGLVYISEIVNGLKTGMSELGYIEGENIVYDIQTTDFDVNKYREIAQKFVDEKVDVIVSFPTEASMIVKDVIKGTNVQQVFVFANIEGTNLVESVNRPGGSTTGVRYPGPDIAVKRFEIMRALVPKAKKILIPYQRGYPIVKSQLEALYPLTERYNISLIELPADNSTELEILLSNIDPKEIDAILAIAEPLFVTSDAFVVLAKFATENKIPIGGAYIKVGGYESIFGVNVDIFGAGKDAAPLVDKILKGTPAGEIPVLTSESYFEISPSVAQKFGLTVPESLLNTANKIIY